MAKTLLRFLASLILVLGLSTAARAQTPAVNPDMTAVCGELDIGVVIDTSGSISASDYDAIIDSLESFLNALANTGNAASIVTFSTTGTVQTDYFDITTANIGPVITQLRAVTTGGNTNYEAGFRALLHSLDGDGATTFGTGGTLNNGNVTRYPDLLMFFTDGFPNTVNASDDITSNDATTSSAGNQTAANAAINEVNAFKANGTHVFSLTFDHGSGSGLLGNLLLVLEFGINLLFPTTPDYAQYIITEITGPGETEWNGAANTLATADYVLVDNFATVFDGVADACLRDLSLTKTVDNGAANSGEFVNFTLTVNNASLEAATGVQVTDLLPTPPNGFDTISGVTSTGTYNSATGLWDIGTIAASGSATLTITARVQSNTTVTNVAEITAADQNDPDSTPNNGVPTEDDYATATVKPSADNPDLVGICENLDIGVILDTSGSISSTEYSDMIDSLEQFMLQYSDRGNAIAIATFANSGNLEQSYIPLTTVNSTLIATNLRTVGTGGGTNYEAGLRTMLHSVDGVAGTSYGLDAGENLGSARYPDLLLFFTDGVPNVEMVVDDSSDNGTATVAQGEASAAAAMVDEANAFKNNATHIFAIVFNSGGSTNEQYIVTEMTGPGAVEWDGSPLTFQAADYDLVTSFANVFADIGSICVTDLALSKTVDNPTPTLGSQVVFTVTVTNQSAVSEATNVVVRDLLPVGLGYASDDAALPQTYNSVTGDWTIGTLAAGATTTLNITADVDAVGVFVNEAEVWSLDQTDVDSTPGNGGVVGAGEDDYDTATVVSADVTIDLSIAKTVDNAAPGPGDTVTFTVTVTNNDPSLDATSVIVTDVLPPETVHDSNTPSTGSTSYSAGPPETLTWTIPTLAAGASATWTIVTTTIDPPPIP